MSDLRCKVGAVTTTTALINCATLSDTTITATCSGGSVAVASRSERIASPYMGTCLITITGLSAYTTYTWTATQGAVTRNGTFRTLPNDQVTDFSFIVTTCDFKTPRTSGDSNYGKMKDLIQSAEIPVLFRVHPDDLNYTDGHQVNDSATGFTSGGAPMATGVAADYAMAWGATYGLFKTDGKWRHRDRQWVNNNLPLQAAVPGDHGYEDNHCRGDVGSGGDYAGCNRAPGDTVPNLEVTAIAEWDSFYGQMFPSPLSAGLLNYGFECGPCRFGMLDIGMTADPLDSVTGGGNFDEARATHPGYGATQLSDTFTYLDNSSVRFKFAFLDTGFKLAGQPWSTWWSDEADDWKTNTLDASNNLNGTDGNFIGFFGDSHAQSIFSFDKFWAFGAGMIDSACIFTQGASSASWSTLQRYFRGALPQDSTPGNRLYGGFIHVIVYASQTPKKVEVRHMDNLTGKILRTYTLTGDSSGADNQMINATDQTVAI